MKEPRRGPELREALFEDYEQISRLEDKYDLETKSREEWEHIWISNPTYKGFEKRWPIGWVLEDEERQIVGYLGNIPLSYEFHGRKLVAAVTHAWVVESPYRGYSILLLDSYFAQKNADLFLSTTLNAQASDGFCVFGSPAVPVGRWDHSAFWITHYRGFVSSWIRMKSVRINLLTVPFSSGLWLQDALKRKSSKHDRNGAKIEAVDSFDRRFDIFWQALRERYPHLLLAVRNSEELEWHFRYAIQKKNVWILTIANGSELTAYSVFCRQDSVRFGLKRMRLVDFQALDGSSSLLLPMLCWALQRCHTEGIHMLECIGLCPLHSDVFESLASRQRRLPSWLYFYKARDRSLAQKLENPQAWRPSWFDGDGTL
jgi:hypothetical protein